MAKYILGISAFYHDSAAALVRDGELVAAAQEERFSRDKHDKEFPVQAVEYCLAEAGIEADDLDYVGFYEKPLIKFDRLIETYLAFAPRGFRSFARALPEWLNKKLHLPREMNRGLGQTFHKRYVFTEHHESHAASAFFPSPFEEAAILTMDGAGEWATGSYGYGRGNKITLTHELRFPHSLGLLYSAFTYFCGFKVNADEYKLMGLAPYGEPEYYDLILEKLMDLREDGSFWLDQSYFNYCQGLTMTSDKFHALLGGPPRQREAPVTQREMNIAASVQKVTEEVMLRAARHVHAETGMRNLCLAGGVALNCVSNGRILREGPFDEVWIQPAAGDAGGALGTALFIWHQLMDQQRTPRPGDSQSRSLLGPEFSEAEMQAVLDTAGASYQRIDAETKLCDNVAELIADGKVVGFFQGRMEFGPRGLGCRSILGDPRQRDMQSIINRKIKFREGFRPFAPAVLADKAHEFFEVEARQPSPYMLLVAPVAASQRGEAGASEPTVSGFDRLKDVRSRIPAVTHVDGSARIQTVDAESNRVFRGLLEAFWRRTGCPVLVNTSFNLSWEPIVCTPLDAYRTYMSSELDVLCMGPFLLQKQRKPDAVPAATEGPVLLGASGLLCCPKCGAKPIDSANGSLHCEACGSSYPVTDGIPQMFYPHDNIDDGTDVTEIVKSFYEDSPFPHYDDHESLRSLIEKARAGAYAQALDRSIPFDCDVLEVGCGTGQLSNYLGVANRRVVGADLCLNSLRLAEGFRRKTGLVRPRFLQMNLFRPCFSPESFDVVLCNGVLMATSDEVGGLVSIFRLVKPGGYIVIGLYNRYGRFLTNVRRGVFKLTGGRGQWLDPHLRSIKGAPEKRRAWYLDQYKHPHETQHSMGQVLRWFDDHGIEFVRGIPNLTPFADDLSEDLFEPTDRGDSLDRFLVQARELCKGSQEGGFFVMIGRKPSGSGG